MSVQIKAGGDRGVRSEGAIPNIAQGRALGSEYAVSRDGQRVYVLEPVASQEDSLHVVTQWDGAGGR